MSERPSPATTVHYGSAKPEQVSPQKPESNIVRGVKHAVNKWLERVGPKGVEDHFVRAHERILATLEDENRIEAYKQTADKWRTFGKAVGIAATVIDTGLSVYGLGLSFIGLKNSEKSARVFLEITKEILNQELRIDPDMTPGTASELPHLQLFNKYLTIPQIGPTSTAEQIINGVQLNPETVTQLGMRTALTPGALSALFTLGMGPAHILSHLAATAAEGGGKIKANAQNYIDSGKAKEHATKTGSAIGKGIRSVTQYATEHPDEIRASIETASRINRQNAESKQKIAEAKQKAAEAKLEAEYRDWIDHHPDKAYYKQSGEPYPSKEDYVAMKERQKNAKVRVRYVK